MAESVQLPDLAVRTAAADVSDAPRHAAIVRVTHWITAVTAFALFLSGIAILLAHPRFYWGETGGASGSRVGPSLFDLPLPFVLDTPIRGPGRYLHFFSAWICVLTGLFYVLYGFFSGHFGHNLLPTKKDLSWRLISDHLRLRHSPSEDAHSYNVVQRLSYLVVIFVLFPLLTWTGLGMSPAVTSVFPWLATTFGGQQSARTIHFFLTIAVVVFVLIHVFMVYRAGFLGRVWTMITGHLAEEPISMSELITRRRLIATGLATAAGLAGVAAAATIADRYGFIPPDHRGIFGAGETLTYAAQRILMSRHSMAREFSRTDISKVIPVNGKHPQTDEYQRLLAGGFADWKLTIDGLVARPTSFSLSDLKGFPAYTQITHQACEEGWSFIAEWKGVRLSDVLNAVGIAPQAKWVFYFSIDKDWWDSIDVPDAMHPQTFLAFGMNGQEIPLDHGAPIRLRVPRQLGYKSVKFVNHISVTDTVKGIGDGLGSGSPSAGYSWYAGI